MRQTDRTSFLFKYQEFLLYVGLTLWLSIFFINEKKEATWFNYFQCILFLSISYLPVFAFALNKARLQVALNRKKYILYWLACFLIGVPAFTTASILLAPKQFNSDFFIQSSSYVLILTLLLMANNYYQKKAHDVKWLKKIGLESAVLLSLILLSLIIAIMGVSSLNNPEYHSPDRLLIGFEFDLDKIIRNFGTFLSFFIQFLFIYLSGYLFFIINSRILVSKILKQKGLILYLLSVFATIAILYPFIAQMLISLPINETLGRDIFSNNAFDFENAFGVIGIMLLSLPIVLAMQWGKQNNHIISLEKEKSQTELDLLKQQLNPHFFFNTLNNLYGLSLQQSEKTSDSILRLAELMRYTIYKGQLHSVDIIQEINYVEDYIQLQQIRLKKTLTFNFEKNITDENLQIAPLLLIVLVENAFKHGIEPAEDNAYLNLSLKSDQNKLYFSCENSVEEEDENKISGIGLSNLEKRLVLVYPNRHTLHIQRTKNKYKAELEIML